MDQRELWKPLAQSSNAFRLLHISNNLDQCQLRQYSLTTPPKYVALSYCWGSTDVQKEIRINDQDFAVTVNLFAALSALARHGFTAVWVDTICIDQYDFEEKGAQVLRMASIFQSADLVVAWLGPDERNIGSLLESFGSSSPAVSEVNQDDDDAWVDIRKMMQADYWRRVWIIQEFAVASVLMIMCGSQLFNAEKFGKCVKWMGTHSQDPDFEYLGRSYGRILSLMKLRRQRREQQPTSLLQLLSNSRFCEAGLEVDRVYAVLGLAFDRSTYVIEPDYRLTRRGLCRSMFKNATATTQRLDFILIQPRMNNSIYQLYGTSHDAGIPWPSWCPDFMESDFRSFMVDSIYHQNPFCGYGKARTHWTAAGSDIFRPPGIGGYKIEGSVLVITGMKLGSNLEVLYSQQMNQEPSNSRITPDGVVRKLNRILLVYSLEYHTFKDSLGLLTQLEEFEREGCNADEGYGGWLYSYKEYYLWGQSIEDWLCRNESTTATSSAVEDMPALSLQQMQNIDRAIDRVRRLEHQSLAVLDQRLLCWVPLGCSDDDVVALLAGCTVPVVLRPHGQNKYSVVGPCILDAPTMEGETWNLCQRFNPGRFEIFNLI